jgi:hypothetical protein
MVEPAPKVSTSSTEVVAKPQPSVQKTALDMTTEEYAALKKSLGIKTNFPGYLGQSS